MEQKPPTAVIESAHREHLGNLPFDDTADFEDADRGFVGAMEPCVVKAADGRVVWDNDVYGFLDAEVPPGTIVSVKAVNALCLEGWDWAKTIVGEPHATRITQ